MNKQRIVIIGGGFAGVKCAQTLLDGSGREQVELVLFNSENHLVFSPLLAEVVGSSINPMDVVVPLRQLLPGIFCRTEEVQELDLKRNEVTYLSEEGHLTRMSYDQAVLACGNVTNLNVVPGMADHGFPLKTVADAAALRSHIMAQMEKAEVCADPERRRWHLTFIVVGGGFSGVEAAGEINDLIHSSARYFRSFKRPDSTVLLIHSRDQILPELSPGLRDFARKKMEQAGVKMLLNRRVALATPEGVGLGEGEFVRGGTIVCTVGSTAAAVMERLPAPKEKGRALTEPDMRLRGCQNVWAIGDCGWIINAHDGQPSPTTGQFAERQGTQCARNMLCALRGQPTKPFSFKALGELCSIGGHSAVADLMGWHLSGFLAWFVWRGVYLFKLPTWGRRVQVGFDWAWLLLFPRDLAHVRPRQTDRVSHAYYQPGDYIFKQGDPPNNFYVIERGEVEIVRATAKDPVGEVVAVLGAGSFFGEKALLNNEPRIASVRARTGVELLVMGKNVFTQVSAALEPFRRTLAQALNRRSVDPWKEQPKARELLQRTSIRELLEPAPQPFLSAESSLREVTQAFVDHGHELVYVTRDGQWLEGVVTLSDLLRARAAQADQNTPAGTFMSRNPVALSVDDNCATAAAALREYRLKSLPVVESKQNRKLVGTIRDRRLTAYVTSSELQRFSQRKTGEQEETEKTERS